AAAVSSPRLNKARLAKRIVILSGHEWIQGLPRLANRDLAADRRVEEWSTNRSIQSNQALARGAVRSCKAGRQADAIDSPASTRSPPRLTSGEPTPAHWENLAGTA